MADVKVDGRNISYRMAERPRKGHTILMIHGATDHSTIWENQFQHLGKEHTPVTVNLPGRSGSDGPPIDNNADFTEFIKALGDALEIAPFVICGHSMGGSISLDFALNYPNRLKGFIMVGSSPSWDFANKGLVDLLRTDPQKGMETSGEEFGDQFSKHTAKHIKEQLFKESQKIPVETGASDLIACSTFHLEGDLGRINLPALVICGDEDEPSLPGSRLCGQKLTNATFQLVERCGHPIMLEQPEILNEAMDRFLSSLSSSRALGSKETLGCVGQ